MIKPPERFTRGDNRRFHSRVYGSERGQRYEVYSMGLEQWADCDTQERAEVVADALEAYFEQMERARNHLEISKLHPGNRLRLMAGLPLLPEEEGK